MRSALSPSGRGRTFEAVLAELLRGAATQARVVKALILREVRTRFGRYYLGYLWAVLFPLMFVLMLTVVFAFIGRRTAHGAPMEVLLLSGMMAWRAFIDTQVQVAGAYQSNRPLLVYPQVTVFDIVIARTVLEFSTKLWATVILGLLFFAVGVDIQLYDPLGIVLGMIMMSYFSMCFGHIVGCIMVEMPSVTFLVATTQRALFFTSGVLFLLSDLPAEWRKYVLYNPLAHIIDYGRGAWIEGYSAPYADMGYVFQWAIGMTVAAIIAEGAVRRRRAGVNR